LKVSLDIINEIRRSPKKGVGNRKTRRSK